MKKKVFNWFISTNGMKLALFGLLFLASGCSNPASQQFEVGKVVPGNPAQANLEISLNEIITQIMPHQRLVKKNFTYQYHQADLVSFPLEPGKYAYFLVITAEATPKNAASTIVHQKFYCELLQKESQLFFIPENFQQSCTSTTCTSCELFLYQNGTFGCKCDDFSTEKTSKCTYEKSRVLTTKQQKSDII